MDIQRLKHALKQNAFSELRKYLIDKLLELKNTEVPTEATPDNYKQMDLGVKLAYKKLHEILSELMDLSQEEIAKSDSDREKDSFKV